MKKIIIIAKEIKKNNQESFEVSLNFEGEVNFVEAFQILKMAQNELGNFSVNSKKENREKKEK